jgi:endonuclease-3
MEVTVKPLRASGLLKKRRQANFILKKLAKFYQTKLTQLSTERKHARAAGMSQNQMAFRILISTILSHRTKDANTQKATDALLGRYPNPVSLSKAPEATIRNLIKPAGFYRVKAGYVKKCSQELVEQFNGIVPRTREELMSLTAVGPKTSACVLNYAFSAPVVAVDTHVHRVSNRLGLAHSKTSEETEEQLTKIVSVKSQLMVNELLVLHGQNTCKPVLPLCSKCPLTSVCKYYQSGARHG